MNLQKTTQFQLMKNFLIYLKRLQRAYQKKKESDRSIPMWVDGFGG